MPKRFTLILLALLLVAPVWALAQEQPAQRPRAVMIERIRDKTAQMDLSAEQKTKVNEILDSASEQVLKLRSESGGNLEAFREKVSGVVRGVREQLQAVLTPEQMMALRDAPPVRPAPEPIKPAATKPDTMKPEMTDKPAKSEKPREMSMDGDSMQSMQPARSESAPATEKPAVAVVPAKELVGLPAPDFQLKRLDGKLVTLQSLKYRPTVLLFGSFTSPTFREHVQKFEDLKKDYRNKANVVIIYTREAYPANEWEIERNLDNQVKVNQPSSLSERMKLADQTRDAAKLDIDILVDDMDDAVATAYDALPNGCVVIDGTGTVVAKQKWADAWGIRSHLDAALRQR